MVTQLGVVGMCMTGVGIIAVDNIRKGHDPFPQLMVGGIFTTGCSLISEVNMGIAGGIAVTFLTATLVLHSSSATDVLNDISKAKTPKRTSGITPTSTKGTTNV